MQGILRWVNVGVVLITLLAYLSPLMPPSRFWPLAVPGLFYPWLLLFNILFVIGWAVMRKRYFLLSLGCILIGANHIFGVVGFNSRATELKGHPALKVMTFNCHGFRPAHGATERTDAASIASLLKEYQPDVVCFQEFPPSAKAAAPYIAAIKAETELKNHYQPEHGTLALFSRFPIKDQSFKYFTNDANGYFFTDLAIGSQTVRVYNIHLQTNAVSGMADKLASEKQFQERETWLRIRGMIGRYGRSARLRSVQAREIAMKVGRSPYPTLACGDFNDVPLSYTYHTLSKGMHDAFRERGSGLGTTFGGSIPALRIDYILAAPKLSVRDFRIIKKDLSDHYPLISTIGL